MCLCLVRGMVTELGRRPNPLSKILPTLDQRCTVQSTAVSNVKQHGLCRVGHLLSLIHYHVLIGRCC